MDATNVVISTGTVGIGYHRQEQPARPITITTTEDDHHTLCDVMTEEAGADPMLGNTRETEVQVTQDTPAQIGTPAGTETQDGDTHQTTTEPRADHPTDSSQAAIDHQLHMPGIILGVDHPHATMISHIDVA